MKHILHFVRLLYNFSGSILYINFFGMMLVGLLDGIGIFLLIPMISLSGVIDVDMAGASSIIQKLFGFLYEVPINFSLPLALGVYLLIVIGQSVLQRFLKMQNTRLYVQFVNHLRLETQKALLSANWVFFMKRRKSDFINIFTTEIGRVAAGTDQFIQLLSSLIFTAIQVVLAFWLSPKITAFVLACGAVLALFSYTFIKKARTLGRQSSYLAQSYMAGMTDQFNGVKDIKTNMLEESRNLWLQQWSRQLETEQRNYTSLRETTQLVYKIASSVLIVCFILLSLQMFQSEPAQLIIITIIFSRLWPRFTGIQASLQQISSSVPAFEIFLDLQRQATTAKEAEKENWEYSKVAPLTIQKGIQCEQLCFRYDKEEPAYTLQNLSLYIPANRTTAIVGRSGSGKSTLIDLLMGLMQPNQGQITIDDMPLTNENLLAFRRSISYVAQDPFLFNASIRDNLLMTCPDATEEELWKALEFSAADFVRNLSEGLDTVIGDRGVRLSGGERQRLVLARAILREPKILVLDEATSALDTENEAKIQQALEQLQGKMTIIVVAHRLSTIRNADQVVVLDEGRIVQIGSFSQLAQEKNGLFRTLLGNQADIEHAKQYVSI